MSSVCKCSFPIIYIVKVCFVHNNYLYGFIPETCTRQISYGFTLRLSFYDLLTYLLIKIQYYRLMYYNVEFTVFFAT